MIYIDQLRHLEQFGIECLTGEADALSLRVLCDVTAQGQKAICAALGIKPEGFNEPWNPGSIGSKHVGSILLDPWQFQMIAVMCLLNSGCDQVLIFTDGSVWGTEKNEKVVDEGHVEGDDLESRWMPTRMWHRDGVSFSWPREKEWPRRIVHNTHNGQYRNEHQMSGRTE